MVSMYCRYTWPRPINSDVFFTSWNESIVKSSGTMPHSNVFYITNVLQARQMTIAYTQNTQKIWHDFLNWGSALKQARSLALQTETIFNITTDSIGLCAVSVVHEI